jgi:hypothetical protein
MACSMKVKILGVCDCGRVLFVDEDGKTELTLLVSIRAKVTSDTPRIRCDFCKGILIDYLDPKSRRIPPNLWFGK